MLVLIHILFWIYICYLRCIFTCLRIAQFETTLHWRRSPWLSTRQLVECHDSEPATCPKPATEHANALLSLFLFNSFRTRTIVPLRRSSFQFCRSLPQVPERLWGGSAGAYPRCCISCRHRDGEKDVPYQSCYTFEFMIPLLAFLLSFFVPSNMSSDFGTRWTFWKYHTIVGTCTSGTCSAYVRFQNMTFPLPIQLGIRVLEWGTENH